MYTYYYILCTFISYKTYKFKILKSGILDNVLKRRYYENFSGNRNLSLNSVQDTWLNNDEYGGSKLLITVKNVRKSLIHAINQIAIIKVEFINMGAHKIFRRKKRKISFY